MTIIPTDWLPDCPMERIHIHWTGGTHTPNSTDLAHYHLLIDGHGVVVRGTPSIEMNSGSLQDGYAAHTKNCNTDAIGISVCAMLNAVENPFKPGNYPITRPQWDALIQAVIELSDAYTIPVTPKTILTHAEVEDNLGVKQENKWDITKGVPDHPELTTAKAVGDYIRSLLVYNPAEEEETDEEESETDNDIVGVTTASWLNFRDAPNGKVVGGLPQGTPVTVLDVSGWLQVKTPAGYVGWVNADYVDMADMDAEG